MSHSTHHHFHYHTTRLSEIKRLYWAHTVKLLASSMTLLFVPIYLYKLDYTPTIIFGSFFMIALLWVVFQYPTFKFANKIGANKAMAIGLLLEGVQALVLATIPIFHWPLWLWVIIHTIAGMLYWPSFRACFAKSLLHKKTGGAVGIAAALTTLAYGIAPAIGGAVASGFGVALLYGVSMLLFVAAALPLFNAQEIIKNDPFNIKELSLRKVWRDFFANFSGTIDDSVLIIIWPLFIFLLIPSYIGVGILSSIAVIAGILISLYVGKREEMVGARKFLHRGTVILSTTNGVRLLAQSAGPIAGVNFVNGLGRALMETPFITRYYENASRAPLLPYMCGMITVSALGDVVLFGTLTILSLFLPIELVLLAGLLLAIPASYAIRLIRDH